MTHETADDGTYQDVALNIRRLLRVAALAPRLEKLPVPLSRLVMEWGSSLASPRRNRRLVTRLHRPSPDQTMSIREWSPPGSPPPRATVLFFHGGGWVVGSSRSHRAFCELIVEQTGCTVFSVDYRRAPEHRFPGPLLDAEQAWQWLLKRRQSLGWSDQAVVVAGDSAGANLATILCRRLRDRGETMPDAQLLLYPVTDFAQDTPSYQKYDSGMILTRPLIDWFFAHYRTKGQEGHEDLSPLQSKDLRGLPPAFVGLAGHDMLRDEGRAYARRLEEAGVKVTLRVFPDMIHAFINLLIVPEARLAAVASISYLETIFKNQGRT